MKMKRKTQNKIEIDLPSYLFRRNFCFGGQDKKIFSHKIVFVSKIVIHKILIKYIFSILFLLQLLETFRMD